MPPSSLFPAPDAAGLHHRPPSSPHPMPSSSLFAAPDAAVLPLPPTGRRPYFVYPAPNAAVHHGSPSAAVLRSRSRRRRVPQALLTLNVSCTADDRFMSHLSEYFHPDHMSSTEKMKLELQRVRDESKISKNDCGSARVQGLRDIACGHHSQLAVRAMICIRWLFRDLRVHTFMISMERSVDILLHDRILRWWHHTSDRRRRHQAPVR